jgi:hypothetical protein
MHSALSRRRREKVDKASLSDGNLTTGVSLAASEFLQFEFAVATPVRALTVAPTAGGKFPVVILEASEDGVSYRAIASLRNPGKHGIQPPGVADFPAVTAKFFRVVPGGAADLAEVCAAPGRAHCRLEFQGELRLSAGPPDGDSPAGMRAGAIDPSNVVDLSAALGKDGRLRWAAPAGAWTILRIGHTPTGQLNVSASAAGTGLECDKFTRGAVEFHF